MSERRVQRGARFELITDRITLPNGRTAMADLLKHPGASAVLPFFDDGRVLLIRQYRFATGGALLEVPAGKLDPGETPETCASRELEEETGWRAARIERLGSIWTSPGFTDEVIHLYRASGLTPGATAHERDEVMEVHEVRWSEVLRMVREREIVDTKTLNAVLFAEMMHRS